jgi:hypothetical protein
MRFNRLLLLSLAVLSLGVVPACSGADDNDSRDDAGTSTDAGTGGVPDAGTSSDAGTDAGTGGEPDASPSADAGTDAGTSSDAGTDAGLDADAGTDAGTGGEPDAGTDAGTGGELDAGSDAGTDPRPSPTATCPAGSIICESFSNGTTGWAPSAEHATIAAENGWLHIVTEDGHDERTSPGQAMARWSRSMPAFGTRLYIRAYVFMRSLPAVLDQLGTFFVVANLQEDFGGLELQVISDTAFALDDWSGRTGEGWDRQPAPVTVGMSSGRWVCLEWELRRATASSTHGNTRVYVDGTLAHDFNPAGMRSFNFFSVGYGFVHPKGPSGSETFIDNVAVSSTQRIGCQ